MWRRSGSINWKTTKLHSCLRLKLEALPHRPTTMKWLTDHLEMRKFPPLPVCLPLWNSQSMAVFSSLSFCLSVCLPSDRHAPSTSGGTPIQKSHIFTFQQVTPSEAIHLNKLTIYGGEFVGNVHARSWRGRGIKYVTCHRRFHRACLRVRSTTKKENWECGYCTPSSNTNATF